MSVYPKAYYDGRCNEIGAIFPVISHVMKLVESVGVNKGLL